MNAIIQHYQNGSATPEWLREMVAIETEGELSPLGAGPLEPEAPAVDPALFEDDKLAYLKDEALAERRALARMDAYDELGVGL